jgi:putative ABC transport system permease protein
MAIPISYNIRNLKLRKGLTIMTALGIALTVTTAIFIMALLAGLQRAFVTSGDPNNVLVLRKGSEAELSGGFDATAFPVLKNLPGIAKDSHGEPMASGEWVVVIVLPRKGGTGEVNVTVRGMMPDGLEMRPTAKLVQGRWFTPGQREVVGEAVVDQVAGTKARGEQGSRQPPVIRTRALRFVDRAGGGEHAPRIRPPGGA